MTFDEMLIEAESKYGLSVKEKPLKYGLKGLYKNGKILIDKKIVTDVERKCILAEEIGHHETTFGDIIDETDISNRKQEIIARRWAYRRMVSLTKIVVAHQVGIRNIYELADFLGVTENFLKEALNYYENKYGNWYSIDNYIIRFNPLGVLEKFEDF